jgi:hypothetical protein
MSSRFSSDMVNNALKQLAADRDTNLGGYQTQVLNTYQTLLDKVTTENKMIEKSYPGLSVAGQKSIYINQSTETLTGINTILYWLYIVVAVILSVMIIRKSFSIGYKIALVIVIIGFPFYIYWIEELTYKLSMYIYSVLLSIVYNNGFANTKLEYYHDGMEDLKKI